MHWELSHKGDLECRELADRHYSRQHVGAPGFCRPGYNLVLKARDLIGNAVWVWFRPKWESGIRGTERKDGLHAIECTLFRNETAILSSILVREAVEYLFWWKHALDVEWPDGAITGILARATVKHRSKKVPAGHCFRCAGWTEMPHKSSERADIWLRAPGGC